MVAVAMVGFAGCFGSNASTVSHNISQEANKFHVLRKIVVQSDITGKVTQSVEGRCAFFRRDRALDVICKDAPKKYTKLTIGLGDNTSWDSVQLGPINVSEYRTKIIFRPTSIVPDFDLVTGETGPGVQQTPRSATPPPKP